MAKGYQRLAYIAASKKLAIAFLLVQFEVAMLFDFLPIDLSFSFDEPNANVIDFRILSESNGFNPQPLIECCTASG